MLNDRPELLDPAPQSGRIPQGEFRKRVHGLVEIGPPLQGSPIGQDQGDVQLGLEIDGPVPAQLQVAVPGHHRDGPVEERMGIVPEAREARVLHRGQPASGHEGPVQAQDAQAAAREVGLQHQGVVAGAENDAVLLRTHRRSSSGFGSNRCSRLPGKGSAGKRRGGLRPGRQLPIAQIHT